MEFEESAKGTCIGKQGTDHVRFISKIKIFGFILSVMGSPLEILTRQII